MQNIFRLQNPIFIFLANFILIVSYLKMHPPIFVVSFKYFESHDVIAVKKKSLLKN